jgi:hypothetical protein
MTLVHDAKVIALPPNENVQRFGHRSPKVAACIGQHHGPNRRVRKNTVSLGRISRGASSG